MLVVRNEQMDVFKERALISFEKEMVERLFRFAPMHCEGIGEENVLSVVKLGMKKSALYGFTNRGPVRFYIELMFLFGSYFDNDPQLPPWAIEILQSGTATDQMQRADQLHARMLEYRQAVVGPGNAYARSAVQKFKFIASNPLHSLQNDLVGGLLAEIKQVYPERYVYVGEQALIKLINEGIVNSERQSLKTLRGVALCVLLMFQLGHGCFQDPLYPWIFRTLKDFPSDDPVQRTQLLERKALAYLELILKRFSRE